MHLFNCGAKGKCGMKTLFTEAFIEGFVRVLDLSGTKEWPEISDGMQSDYEALRKDWENVGENIRKSKRNCSRV